MSGVKVETSSKGDSSLQIVGCLNTTHSHTTASKKVHNPVKVMFTLLQNTLSGYGGYVYETVSMCECGVDIFLSPDTSYLLNNYCCSLNFYFI